MKSNLLQMLDDAINDTDESIVFCIECVNTDTSGTKILRYPKSRLIQLRKFINKRFTDFLFYKKNTVIIIYSACISRKGCTEDSDKIALKMNEDFIMGE